MISGLDEGWSGISQDQDIVSEVLSNMQTAFLVTPNPQEQFGVSIPRAATVGMGSVGPDDVLGLLPHIGTDPSPPTSHQPELLLHAPHLWLATL
jgi:hypothetical protein